MKFVQFKEKKEGKIFLFIICLKTFYEKYLFYILAGMFLRKESRSPLLCE